LWKDWGTPSAFETGSRWLPFQDSLFRPPDLFRYGFHWYRPDSTTTACAGKRQQGPIVGKAARELGHSEGICSQHTYGKPDLKHMCQQVSSIDTSITKKEEPSPAKELLKEQWSNFHKANLVAFDDVILDDFLTVRQIEAGKI
jgi:hypothetical protein